MPAVAVTRKQRISYYGE